jgi:putative ABC transport system permease protein
MADSAGDRGRSARTRLARRPEFAPGCVATPRRRAIADFGSLPAAVETYRDQRRVPWIEDGWRDIQLAGRGVARSPLFASAIIATLALAIAAHAAVFSIVSGVLLRPLNHPDPEQLMYIDSRMPAFPRLAVSVAEYLEFQQFTHAFTAVGAYRTAETTLGTGDRAVRVRSATVDMPLLRVLGLRVMEGRLFDDVATGVGATSAEVVISEELWRSVFAGRTVIGETVEVAGRSRQIVGVMAYGASLVDAVPDVWLPLTFAADELLQRNNHNLLLIGRLKDGVSVAATQRELDDLMDTWGARVGITPGGQGHAGHVLAAQGTEGHGHVLRITPLVDQILGRAGRAIWMLQVAVGLVVIVACANLMNLLPGGGRGSFVSDQSAQARGCRCGRACRSRLARARDPMWCRPRGCCNASRAFHDHS